jgi:hypothetical protein
MSTNFHWAVKSTILPTGAEVRPDTADPLVHIGLRSRDFAWAQDPAAVERIAAAHPHARLIEDEYGQKYTWSQFKAMLAGCQERRELIGQWFS